MVPGSSLEETGRCTERQNVTIVGRVYPSSAPVVLRGVACLQAGRDGGVVGGVLRHILQRPAVISHRDLEIFSKSSYFDALFISGRALGQ